ncbi:exodeoxyribonuclease VII large subunit [Phaeocystidibacter luteus]|uniref:Exodeoxyribonuclease 7 large subunit n=1 Tax=Phaeocystidibacter luteus TaxID=911197 RepID=A0A6N6RLT3_9FLAO|nr:exodeoxyribonuclease VII large subunit [Phaeocystidibacter luteus]KAB2814523.1 exodeoxyribonuclease VII large subunit [Phaeocystidibacter luteus]
MSVNSPSGHSLSRVLARITELFEEKITPHEVWVKAEISSYKRHGSGHHYFDLVEQRNDVVIARARAALWRGQADSIELTNKLNLSNILENGREVLCKCRITYHQVYGLSLHVVDVDPNFALGEMERRRKETIARLQKEGLLLRNRQLHLPAVIQRIALIAAENSAGLADLSNQLHKNSYGFVFRLDHYPASVQGTQAAGSIVKAFQSIDLQLYDAIVIIRGGGSALDLDSFNDYALNAQLAKCSIPVIVGIGHETDRTVMDEWAAQSLKTPSAVGAWIVERARDFEVEVSTNYQSILEIYRSTLERQRSRQNELTSLFTHYSREYTRSAKYSLETTSRNFKSYTEKYSTLKREVLVMMTNLINSESRELVGESRHTADAQLAQLDRFSREIRVRNQHKLKMLEELIEVYSPTSTLKRGYTYLLREGAIVTKGTSLKKGEEIGIETTDSRVTAEVKHIERNNG